MEKEKGRTNLKIGNLKFKWGGRTNMEAEQEEKMEAYCMTHREMGKILTCGKRRRSRHV